LCLHTRDSVSFLTMEGDQYTELSRFKTRSQNLSMVLKENGAAIVGEDSAIHIFDFTPEDLPTVERYEANGCVSCDLLGQEAMVSAQEDGKLVVYLTKPKGQSYIIAEMKEPSAISAFGPIDQEKSTFLIACGGRDGTVGIWRWRLNELTGEEVFREKVHKGMVTSVCFVGEKLLLSGGVDKKIYPLNLTSPSVRQEPFELKLQCQGMKVEGLKGKKEREMLLVAGAVNK
ncbi:MAG: hypothetical protein JWN14_5070, partial [Chthonomonadales bacterium]|nr:hypothetical protein [Chthonomonadales bacterium]